MRRIERQHMLEGEQGVVRTFQIGESIAEAVPPFGIVGLELDGLVAGLEGLLKPPLLLQRLAEAGKIFRPGVLPDRAGQPLQRVIVLFGCQRQQSHQMQAVGVIGIRRQRLLAT